MTFYELDSERPPLFTMHLKAFPVFLLPGPARQDIEKGGKIILPPSSLNHLTNMNIAFPMLFKLTNAQSNRITHCGVLEFIAEEGHVYLPHWMMRNLVLEEGGAIRVQIQTLPVATFSKFQPQNVDFLEITDQKAVLENSLRNFACLTTGDIIAIYYNNKIYEFSVLETRPGKAVSIIECDMNVEFAPPVGYEEPESKPADENGPPPVVDESESMDVDGQFIAFHGKGSRVDGKETIPSVTEKTVTPPRRGIPDHDYKLGTLRFIRTVTRPDDTSNDESPEDSFVAFSGTGQTLRKTRE